MTPIKSVPKNRDRVVTQGLFHEKSVVLNNGVCDEYKEGDNTQKESVIMMVFCVPQKGHLATNNGSFPQLLTSKEVVVTG